MAFLGCFLTMVLLSRGKESSLSACIFRIVSGSISFITTFALGMGIFRFLCTVGSLPRIDEEEDDDETEVDMGIADDGY